MSARPKFSDPDITATGERRAAVELQSLQTLWFNTGTLCNLACENCYIESSPRNDRLAYLSRAEVQMFLQEARVACPQLREIGFTGGEPFMNPHILGMLEDALASGRRVLVLTNAMRPMQKLSAGLLQLDRAHPGQLTVRVSMDHYTKEKHEAIRGARSWSPTLAGLTWLAARGFSIAVAARLVWDEPVSQLREGFRKLFEQQGVAVDANDPAALVLFPEMDASVDVPEITESCWDKLGKSPRDVMCAHSRMIVKHKGAAKPSVISCTLLPYDARFDLGSTLAEAHRPVKLNHPHCSKFCVLGGASCSG